MRDHARARARARLRVNTLHWRIEARAFDRSGAAYKRRFCVDSNFCFLLQTTDTQNQNADAYKRDIYGWLFAAMRATLVVNRIDNKDGAPSRALAKFRALLPVFIIAPLFLFRTRRLLTYAGELEVRRDGGGGAFLRD